ncbi:hypothetical protein [Actinocorallia herbida]|uniref:hypothetical protein n=1 Tax=Actinocorallia herbida TaxID=58109 RepID=UPI0011CE75FE|nr:hypothetical protein [Actinocorallia herbida]
MDALVIEPVDPFGGGEFEVGETFPGPGSWLDQLGREQADPDSISALSRASPTVPIEASGPASIGRAAKEKGVYRAPASE